MGVSAYYCSMTPTGKSPALGIRNTPELQKLLRLERSSGLTTAVKRLSRRYDLLCRHYRADVEVLFSAQEIRIVAEKISDRQLADENLLLSFPKEVGVALAAVFEKLDLGRRIALIDYIEEVKYSDRGPVGRREV